MTGDLILATADASVRRLTSLLRSIDASEAAAVGAWSVRDVAAHLAGGIEAYEPILQRMGSPVAALEELAAYNAEVVASVDERDLGVLATRIDAGFDQARTLAQHLEPSTEISWHGGLRLPVSTLFAAMAAKPWFMVTTWLAPHHDRGPCRPPTCARRSWGFSRFSHTRSCPPRCRGSAPASIYACGVTGTPGPFSSSTTAS